MKAALAFCLLAAPAHGLTLGLPAGAELTREVRVEEGARTVPVGPADGQVAPVDLAQGAITIQAYRVAGEATPAALMSPLAKSLTEAGFRTLLSCETESCGGFDFRFSLELIPPPDMFVDLGDFVFLSAREGDAYVSAVASRSARAGYLHVAQIVPLGTAPVDAIIAPAPTGPIGATLEAAGRVVLEDIVFESGSTSLPEPAYASLDALAAYLIANPDKTVALVGHTDASGALDVNIAISKQRAQAARTLLIESYDVPSRQVAAEGMGYLSPRATNLTEAGRTKNRRVEAILTSTRP
ncbi:MAG: OmpA family protein [Pseudomonadota bacterium]